MVSDIPECADVVGSHGLTFPAGDENALRESLGQLCGDAAAVAAYRKTAREHVCSQFNWDTITKQTMELYQ